MAQLQILQSRLTEAEQALHDLVMSKRTVTIGFEGRSVTYGVANIPELKGYIEWLRSEISTAANQGQSRTFTPQTSRGLS